MRHYTFVLPLWVIPVPPAARRARDMATTDSTPSAIQARALQPTLTPVLPRQSLIGQHTCKHHKNTTRTPCARKWVGTLQQEFSNPSHGPLFERMPTSTTPSLSPLCCFPQNAPSMLPVSCLYAARDSAHSAQLLPVGLVLVHHGRVMPPVHAVRLIVQPLPGPPLPQPTLMTATDAPMDA
jgi:hypothetical protein